MFSNSIGSTLPNSTTVLFDGPTGLLEPYNYIRKIPGKQIRAKFILAFDHWLSIPKDKLDIILEITEMLHNASLIIDDIEDNSKMRRGIPAAHCVYGIAQVINTGTYVSYLALEKIFSLGKTEQAARIFTEHILEMHRGQAMDISWRDSHTCPTEKEYLEMIDKKTGALFRLGIQLMQLFSTNDSNFNTLLELLGNYFQIRDDYANLTSDEYTLTKSFCEDITEGKFSLPIIHAIRADPKDHQILYILKQRTPDNDIKRFCVDLIKKMGSFEYTLKVLSQLEKRILEEIKNLGGNPNLSKIILELHKICHSHSG